MVYIEVRDGNLDSALRFIRRKLQRDGCFKTWKACTFHETEGEKNRRMRYDAARKIQRRNRTHVVHGRNVNAGTSVANVPLDLIYQPELLASYMSAKYAAEAPQVEATEGDAATNVELTEDVNIDIDEAPHLELTQLMTETTTTEDVQSNKEQGTNAAVSPAPAPVTVSAPAPAPNTTSSEEK